MRILKSRAEKLVENPWPGRQPPLLHGTHSLDGTQVQTCTLSEGGN